MKSQADSTESKSNLTTDILQWGYFGDITATFDLGRDEEFEFRDGADDEEQERLKVRLIEENARYVIFYSRTIEPSNYCICGLRL